MIALLRDLVGDIVDRDDAVEDCNRGKGRDEQRNIIKHRATSHLVGAVQESVGQYSYFDLSSRSIVVFTDMRGFTALPETADPEEIMDVLRFAMLSISRTPLPN